MSDEKNDNTNINDYKPSVSWFLSKNGLIKREGKNGNFYRARVFQGTILDDGKDISGFTYTFDEKKLKEIQVYENSPDFIKDEEFRKNNAVIYFNEETNIKLREPYDKNNPDKELETLLITAKELCTAQKNRNKSARDINGDKDKTGTKERLTDRAINATKSNNDLDVDKEIDRETDI